MKEKNRLILKKAIGEMPTFKLEPVNFWERFDNQPDKKFNTQNDNPISDLPKYIAPEGIWERVEYGLNKRPNNSQLWSINYLTRVAAAAVIILSIGFGLIFIKHKYITGSSKEADVVESIKPNSKNETGVISIYNPALCKGNPQICTTALYKALDKQLNEVKGELDLMEPMIRKEDPQMMKYFYRLENLRVEIEKKMVKLILES